MQGVIPIGFEYQEEFLTRAQEASLLEKMAAMPLAPFQMRGVTSKRLVMHYGWDYHYDLWKIKPAEPLPDFLVDLRRRAAALWGKNAAEFEEALINGYPPGAGIGWHRDAPMFGSPVIGISLGSPARLRFRRKVGSGFDLYEQMLEPRSIYSLDKEARQEWQHMIPPAKALRYSITFRTIVKR